MEVKIDKKKTTAKITVSLSAGDLVDYFKKSYERLAPGVKIDGFRPGKAPRKLIEASLGVSRLLSDALDLAINETYFKALVDNKINAVSNPKMVINKYPNYGQTEEEIGQGLEYEAEVEFLADVELGDYSKIKIKKEAPQKATDEDLAKVLDHFQKQASTYEDKEGPAKKGDHIEINFDGFLKKVKVDQMCSKNHPLILGENTMIPGFEDELIGLKKGDKKEFKIKFPKDYHSKDYAGKEADFKIEMVAVKSIKKPEIDDKFAEKFGHKNVADLKKAIKENLDHEYLHESQFALENKVFEKIIPLLKVDLPQSLIEKEIDRMVSEYSASLGNQGVILERFLESKGKKMDDLRKDMSVTAEKNIKIGLILGKIIEELKIDHRKPESAKEAMDHLIKTVTE